MNPAVMIFDFDGTIADTHHYVIKIVNRLAHEFEYKTIEPDEIPLLKDKKPHEFLRHMRVPLLKLPAILAKARKEFQKGIEGINPIEGLPDVLRELNSRGTRMGIVSSNSVENIQGFLKNHGLEVFDFIHSSSRLLSKHLSLEKLIAENGLDRQHVLYIGDEVRDIVAARKARIRIAAVTWGYNSQKALTAETPDFLVSKPEALLELCRP